MGHGDRVQPGSEDAYLDYLQSDPEATCNPRGRAAYGTPQVRHPDAGVVYAKDVAEWTVQCVSLADPLPQYDLKMWIHFDYYAGSTWVHMEEETKVECLKPAVSGQAWYIDCINLHTYSDEDHVSLGHMHRAHFTLVEPVEPDLHFFSETWNSTLAASF